ncbi:peptidase inhibitor family I36 protein [Actinosynnema sp. NPDC050801]|uniref:peptidase inhibitor family I36 protein n=1 Tax=unclassified Actinosynnema TaxID=2637065 RepID=UPI0033F0EF36
MTTRGLVTALALTAGALASGGTAVARQQDPRPGPQCDRGEFCVWSAADYTGDSHRLDLETANPRECIPLPDGFVARSFANRLNRDVSVYQGATCSTEAEFTTYPGKGTYVPDAPFVVRAIQVWEP